MPTKIEWSDEVWNPTLGCSKVSPGCGLPLPGQKGKKHGNCYACGVAARNLRPEHEGLTIRRPGEVLDWTGEVRCLPERLEDPLRWRKPRRVFVDSMSDLFHPDVPDEFIERVFGVMQQAHRHTFQVLTKRPQRMHDWVHDENERNVEFESRSDYPVFEWEDHYPNVWLGASIETDRYTFRADHLRETPAAVRFLSCEPLLGPLPSLDLKNIDWVIVGGESGPNARPAHPDWARDLRDRCVDAGVPFLFKQWGAWQAGSSLQRPSRDRVVLNDGRVFTWDGYRETFDSGVQRLHPEVMARVGKKAAGRELDGRTWDEFPA